MCMRLLERNGLFDSPSSAFCRPFPNYLPSEASKTTTSNQSFNSNPKQAEPKLTVKTSSDKQSIQDSVTSHPVESETSLVNKELSKADEIDSKPKEAAVDSGIDSEQVDTHYKEEMTPQRYLFMLLIVCGT